jgi:hypothetical protein
MIAFVDDALKELVMNELSIRNGSIEVAFDQPRREWSSQVNKPTINFYLFDIKENVELRGSEQMFAERRENGNIAIKRNPSRIDLFYLITCWTRDTQDQHRLLSNVLVALLRNPFLPEAVLPEPLKYQPSPIRIKIAQGDILANVTDLWSTMDNEMRPGLRMTVTISVEPHKPEIFPMVTSAELRFFQEDKDRAEPVPAVLSHTYHVIGGQVRSQKHSMAVLKLVVRETGQEISVNPEGEFSIARLQEGDYHLDVLVNGRVIKQHAIHVPSSSYDIEV